MSKPGSLKDEIFGAIHSGNLDIIKRLVGSDNANIKDRSGHTLLHAATNLEKNEIAKWLVSIGSEINTHCSGNTAISLALAKGNFEMFDFYLKNNGDCKGRNQLNLLHEAANKDRCDIVETLIDKGCDPNQLNNLHYTPLTISVSHSNKKICQVLLESGACATIPDKKGNTALHLACQIANADIINVLLDNAECDFRLRNSNDETCLDILWISMIKEPKNLNLEILNKLLLHGAVFSMPWNFGFTASGHVSFIKLMSVVCKYRLNELFINEKPLFTNLIINGYWRNSLIVSIKAAIIDYKVQKEQEQGALYKAIETIILSNEMDLTETDLCSTFYMFEEVDEFDVFKKLKKNVYSGPLLLKDLARIQIRESLTTLDSESVEKLSKLSEPLQKFLLFEN